MMNGCVLGNKTKRIVGLCEKERKKEKRKK